MKIEQEIARDYGRMIARALYWRDQSVVPTWTAGKRVPTKDPEVACARHAQDCRVARQTMRHYAKSAMTLRRLL